MVLSIYKGVAFGEMTPHQKCLNGGQCLEYQRCYRRNSCIGSRCGSLRDFQVDPKQRILWDSNSLDNLDRS